MSILDAIAPYRDELVAIRRDIHAHPEMGLEEVRTAALVAGKLRDFGVEVTEGVGGTGVVGVLRGKRPGQRAVGLRADMDALMIHEATGLPYASTRPGVMHACGHDGHTTMLLGAARYLADNRDFAGTVTFIFQPAEEGRGGARAMVADGLFERFPCDAIYGLHNKPGLPIGHFATRPGPVAAAPDRWTVIFRGTGGHGGSTPHLSTDLTVAASQFMLGLQTIVSRNVAARDTAVLSIGHVAGGSADSPNVMPAELTISGVGRSFDEKVRDILEARLRKLAQTQADAHGCEVEVEYGRRGLAVVNAPEPTATATKAMVSLVGEAAFVGDAPPSTGSEDFSVMMQVVPGCMSSIGNGADGATPSPRLHTPRFDFNDEAIPYGIGFWVGVVAQELGWEGDAPRM
jgi:hippurate hydrolase